MYVYLTCGHHDGYLTRFEQFLPISRSRINYVDVRCSNCRKVEIRCLRTDVPSRQMSQELPRDGRRTWARDEDEVEDDFEGE